MLRFPTLSVRRTFESSQYAEQPGVTPVRIALIGDSLSTGFHVSSKLSMLRLARQCKRNWLVDDSGEIDSVFERLSRKLPIIVHHYGYVSADVSLSSRRKFVDRLTGTIHMSDQVTRVLKLKKFPEIILLWIGHNELDWAKSEAGELTEERLGSLADGTVKVYAEQLQRVLQAAAEQRHAVTIMVFALVSFELFFQARAEAEATRAREPERFPYLEVDYRYFRSMRPEFRAGMIRLANAINTRLKSLVTQLGMRPKSYSNVSVVFSTALHDAEINRAEMLCAVDGWHPSALGHRTLAQSVFPVIFQQIAQQRQLPQSCQASGSP